MSDKIYKLAKGYYSDYRPEAEHKDMAFLSYDKRTLFINGVSYEGCGIITNIEAVIPTIKEIEDMVDPQKGLIYYCLENNYTYQFTTTGWHRKVVKMGDFINVKDYSDGVNIFQNALLYFDGEKLNNSYNGVTSYLLDNLNKEIYWYEGE